MRRELGGVDDVPGEVVQLGPSARASSRSRVSVPKNWKPSDGGRLAFMPGGMPTNFASGPNVASSRPGPNVPACSGPATNSQNGSKSVNFARVGW